MTPAPLLEGEVWLVTGGRPAQRLAFARALADVGVLVAVTGANQAWLMDAHPHVDLVLSYAPGDHRSAEVAVQSVADRHGVLNGVVVLDPDGDAAMAAAAQSVQARVVQPAPGASPHALAGVLAGVVPRVSRRARLRRVLSRLRARVAPR